MKRNKLNMAVIGASAMGERHIQSIYENEHANLYAVCDTDKKRLEGIEKRFSPNMTVLDYRELIDLPELDAVVIVTPDQLHREMTEAFLRAGKDVLCEKPMALTVEECLQMMTAEKESGRKLMIGQVCRCTPAFIKAKEIVDQGIIGDLYFVESEYAHCYEWIEGAGQWRKTPERDGFIGGGCHAVDLLRWIAGNPTEVSAYANHKCLTKWPANDCTIAIFRFPNDVIGKVFASIGCRRQYTMRTVLYGTKGTIICDNSSSNLTLYAGEEQMPDGEMAFTKPTSIPVDVNNHNVGKEIQDFIDSILGDAPLSISSNEGADTIAACCAAVRAAAENKPQKIAYPRV